MKIIDLKISFSIRYLQSTPDLKLFKVVLRIKMRAVIIVINSWGRSYNITNIIFIDINDISVETKIVINILI